MQRFLALADETYGAATSNSPRQLSLFRLRQICRSHLTFGRMELNDFPHSGHWANATIALKSF